MKKKLIIFLVLLCVIKFTSCSKPVDETIFNQSDHSAMDVSIIQLIANPGEYDGRKVRVIGVGNLEFEGNGVYLSHDDLKYVSKNGIWIELGEKATPYDEAKKFNGKYVIIEGTFDMYDMGHFGMWSGAIIDITRYELWEDKIYIE